MSLKISMEVRGNAQRKLRNLRRTINLAIPKTLNVVGRKLVLDVKRRIAVTKTDPVGVKWAPWAFSTLKQRSRRGTLSRGIMYDSGKLLRSFSYETRQNNTLAIGSTVEYAKYHQTGTRYMKQRQLINMNTPQVKKMVKKEFIKQIKKGLK